MVSRIVEDVDINEPSPPTVSSVVPVSVYRRDTQIFATSVAQRSTSQPDDFADNDVNI